MSETRFEGVSKKGAIQEALANAITAAKDGLRTDFVAWRLEELSGEYGGFAMVRNLTAKIHVRSPSGSNKKGKRK
jgi:hypothetical protein